MLFLALWTIATIVIGSALTSYHLPFRLPSRTILSLVAPTDINQWEAVHILSGSCGCSQRVMRHLLQRRPLDRIREQILMIGGEAPDLPDTADLPARLRLEGYSLTRIAATDIPAEIGLHGLPLLVVASPNKKIAYLGGYGPRGDQDIRIFKQVQSGEVPETFSVLGCAVGATLRRKADPLHLKY
jgi:hypothetical protein